MKNIWLKIFVLALLVISYGCATIYKVAVDERSVKTMAQDKLIVAKIVANFLDDDSIKVLDISAACYNGQVYLVGEYETQKQKEQAIAIAKGVEGVKSVSAYLLPKKEIEGCKTADNLKMMAKVKAALIKDTDIWSTNVDVKVIQCNAVLLGAVGSENEINKSIAHAKGVEGVKAVKSYLMVQKR